MLTHKLTTLMLLVFVAPTRPSLEYPANMLPKAIPFGTEISIDRDTSPGRTDKEAALERATADRIPPECITVFRPDDVLDIVRADAIGPWAPLGSAITIRWLGRYDDVLHSLRPVLLKRGWHECTSFVTGTATFESDHWWINVSPAEVQPVEDSWGNGIDASHDYGRAQYIETDTFPRTIGEDLHLRTLHGMDERGVRQALAIQIVRKETPDPCDTSPEPQ